VVLQQDTNGLPSNAWHQSPLDGLFGHQSNGPTSLPFWGIAAYHRDNALLLIGVQHFGRSGTLFLVQSTIQSGVLVSMTEASN
jgi:hypothetical protein